MIIINCNTRWEVTKEKNLSDNAETVSRMWLSKLFFNHYPTVLINDMFCFVSKFLKVSGLHKSAFISKNLAVDNKR